MNKQIVIWAGILWLVGFALGQNIKNSKHNLSSGSGPGSIKSSETNMVCIFCHTSHMGNAFAPMWNRGEGAPVYTVYTSSTLYSVPGQPDGASKLCLSCHDGTIALGRVLSRRNELKMLNVQMGRIPKGRKANLGSDLSDDHPISFTSNAAVNSNPELNHPPAGDKVRYDGNGKIQCTTCHDPHYDINGYFLVKSNHGGSICKTCHRPAGYLGISSHDISTVTWNGTNGDPWPHTDFNSVAANSCMNCHRSHNAEGKERLLTDIEENICLICHNNNVSKDVQSLLNRPYTHRVRFYQGDHDPAENILSAPKHVECVDCHNPHQANRIETDAPHVKGSLTGVSGMAISGAFKENALYAYEVCLKCHGQDQYRVTTGINRMFDTGNIRIAIQPANASYHAIAAQGTAGWIPSLKPPYNSSSRLYCTDCHNSNTSANAGGSGPNGPHGSIYEFLLERRYETSDYLIWATDRYDLCFKCHDPNILMDENISGFPMHGKHIREGNTPCSVCHDPHGSPKFPGLLNFDASVVFPNEEGSMTVETIGNKGYCFLQCHGENHSPKEYMRR